MLAVKNKELELLTQQKKAKVKVAGSIEKIDKLQKNHNLKSTELEIREEECRQLMYKTTTLEDPRSTDSNLSYVNITTHNRFDVLDLDPSVKPV